MNTARFEPAESAGIKPRIRRGDVAQGHHVPQILCPAEVLAECYVSPFNHPIWEGLEDPITKNEVSQALSQGALDPPSPERLGEDLRTREEHIQRIAWLIANTEQSDPIVIEATPVMGFCFVEVADGHHRLATELFRQGDIVAECVLGKRSCLDQLLLSSGVTCLDAPADTWFGEGVFPAFRNDFARIEMDPYRSNVWITSLLDSRCLARYSNTIWIIEGWDVSQRYSQIAGSSSHYEHWDSFALACCERIFGDNPRLKSFMDPERFDVPKIGLGS